MALTRRSKTDGRFFQDIPKPDERDRLRDKIMEIMKDRLKAREYKIQLDKELLELNRKSKINKDYIEQLDYRIDTLTKRYIEL